MAETNYMSFYGGHDANFTFYNVERNEFLTVELEKLIDVKHISWDLRRQTALRRPAHQLDYDALWHQLHHLLKTEGWSTRFQHLITGSYYRDFKQSPDTRLNRADIPLPFDFNLWGPHKGHHKAHAIGAIAQLPPEKAVVLTVDGGGDDGVAGLWLLDRNNKKFKHVSYVTERTYSLGGIYRNDASHVPSIASNTHNYLDLAGKVMGLSGYGKDIGYNNISRTKGNKLYDKLRQSAVWGSELSKFYTTYGSNNYLMMYPEKHDWREDADICATIQARSERLFDRMIEKNWPDFDDMLEQHDRQLIMSGGYAMNILNNKRIEEKYNCTVWVPPNPGDNGLAFGMLAQYLNDRNIINFWKDRFDNSTFGPEIRDASLFDDYKNIYQPKKIVLSDLSKMLKQGAIVALMQGRSETGFRSLGARSILCDPSIVTKDQINTIKRREEYRPFAPVCLWSEANRWFDVKGDNNYKHMNIAVDVKEEYRKKLHAITHVDGTARLQAIDEAGFMHDLLTEFDGVLLNTSFNLSGKPICNSMTHALYMLDNTPLDNLVIQHNDELWCFNKYENIHDD